MMSAAAAALIVKRRRRRRLQHMMHIRQIWTKPWLMDRNTNRGISHFVNYDLVFYKFLWMLACVISFATWRKSSRWWLLFTAAFLSAIHYYCIFHVKCAGRIGRGRKKQSIC
jgi:hypothetical protein